MARDGFKTKTNMQYKDNIKKREIQYKNLNLKSLLPMLGWVPPAASRPPLSKNGVLHSKSSSKAAKTAKVVTLKPNKNSLKNGPELAGNSFFCIDWLTLNLENEAVITRTEIEKGTFEIGSFQFDVIGRTKNCEGLIKVFYLGEAFGIMQAVPLENSPLNQNYSTLKLENHLLYSKGWHKLLKLFLIETDLTIKSIARIDLALDIENSDLFYFAALQENEFVTDWERKNSRYNKVKIYTGERGEIGSFSCGSKNRYFTIYNKTKEIEDNRDKLGNKKKQYIENCHKKNGLTKTVFRHEIRLTHEYLRTVSFKNKFAAKGNKHQKAATEKEIYAALCSPYHFKEMFFSIVSDIMYYVPAGKKAIQANRLNIFDNILPSCKLEKVKKNDTKVLSCMLSLLRSTYKAAATDLNFSTQIDSAVELLNRFPYLTDHFNRLRRRWYKDISHKAKMIGIPCLDFRQLELLFKNGGLERREWYEYDYSELEEIPKQVA